MPTGKGRRQPPPGHITAAQTGELLGQSRMYKLAEAGRLHRYTPPGQKHGYYLESEVQTILDQDKAFFEEKLHKISAHFIQAKPSDVQAWYELATRIFGPGTISAEKRRALVEAEPRGNYLLKRDGSNEVIAYFYVQSLSHERILEYLKDCRGSTIRPDQIRKLEPGQHELVIAGIGRDPRADRQYVAAILHGFRRELTKWGHEGIDISRFYAYSETLDGVFLCFSMGMELYERPRYIEGSPHFKFIIDVATSNIPLLRDYKRALQEYRVSHGLIAPIPTTPHIDKPVTTPRAVRGSQPASEISTSSAELPDGLIGLAEYARIRGIPPTTLKKAVDAGRVPAIRGAWKKGKATVQIALDEQGQARVDELYGKKQEPTLFDE